MASRDKTGSDPARIGAAHEDLMYNGETLRTGGRNAPQAPAKPAEGQSRLGGVGVGGVDGGDDDGAPS